MDKRREMIQEAVIVDDGGNYNIEMGVLETRTGKDFRLYIRAIVTSSRRHVYLSDGRLTLE